MAAAVAGYRTSLGSDGPPTCYDDIDHADVVLIIGSNMAEAHPVTFDRLRAAKQGQRRTCAIIVVDPRRTPTAAIADLLRARGARRRHRPAQRRGPAACWNATPSIVGFVARHTRGFAEYSDFLLAQDLDELCAVGRRRR